MRISNPKKTVARKAVKTTARHTAKGAASKVKRKPVRSVTLVGAGALAGLAAGYAIGSRGDSDSRPSEPITNETPQPAAASASASLGAESPEAAAA